MSSPITPLVWIQVVGSKKTGKTSLLESITRELVRRGRDVCFVKHTHESPVLDGTDTDTERLRRAGARTTVLAGESSTVVFRTAGGEPIDRIARRDAGSGEIVLAEGFKDAPGNKIVLSGGDLDASRLSGVIAVVGDPPAAYRGPVFRPDEIRKLCDLVEDTIAEPGGKWATSLTVDGREIPLNAFVQDIMAAGLMGMSSALDGVNGGTVLEVRCRRKETGERSGDA